MDVKLCSQLKTLSADARLYMSSIKNADGQLAQPGDLLLKGGDYGACVKEWVGHLNLDANRKFNICSSHTRAASNLQNGQDHDDNNQGAVTVACRGNKHLMRSGKCKKKTFYDYGDEHNDEDYYEFEGVHANNLLNMKQIQQLRRIGQDHTQIWFWAHYQRVSASKIQQARRMSESILSRLKLTLKDILHVGEKVMYTYHYIFEFSSIDLFFFSLFLSFYSIYI